ncbi:hypothetical protein GCM10027268_16310 [Brachybacterium huguangmaarense]
MQWGVTYSGGLSTWADSHRAEAVGGGGDNRPPRPGSQPRPAPPRPSEARQSRQGPAERIGPRRPTRWTVREPSAGRAGAHLTRSAPRFRRSKALHMPLDRLESRGSVRARDPQPPAVTRAVVTRAVQELTPS